VHAPRFFVGGARRLGLDERFVNRPHDRQPRADAVVRALPELDAEARAFGLVVEARRCTLPSPPQAPASASQMPG
jgi:hypothetical protein